MRKTLSWFIKSPIFVFFTESFFQIEIRRINTEIAVEILQLKSDAANTKKLALLIEKATKNEP